MQFGLTVMRTPVSSGANKIEDVFQDGHPMAIGETELLALALTRSKREDNSRITYESQFTKWKVLIGPDDWENYSAGKGGVPKYRVESLPGSSRLGVYEIAICPAGSGKIDPDKVVVVYVGKAEDVRTRLQQYGRTGSHLGRSCHGEKGSGCFQDIFSRGYSIVYRRLPTKSNAEAQKKEDRLLRTYDYPWNKGSNGARRHDDIMKKLEKPDHTTLAIFSSKHLPALQKEVGIKINASKLLSHDNEFCKYADGGYNIFRQVFKINRSQPRLILDHGGFNENDRISCGVPLGDGSICRRPRVEGRKRCAEHKGKKTKGSSMRLNPSEKSQPHKPCSEYGVLDNGVKKIPSFDIVPSLARKFPETEQRNPICGVAMSDGSLCRSQPVSGRKRCDLHKGERIRSSNSETTRYHTVPYLVSGSYANETSSFDKGSSGIFFPGKVETRVASQRPVSIKDCNTICGVDLGDGYFCTRELVKGRIRCEDHKGMRVNGSSNSCNQNYGSSSSSKSICGAPTLDGFSCQRPPAKGNERCWQHKNYGSSSSGSIFSPQCSNYGGCSSKSICGAPTLDGFSCQRPPAKGNERCWQHNYYGSYSSSLSIFSPQYSNYGGCSASICGAPTLKGSPCRRPSTRNGRCWQH